MNDTPIPAATPTMDWTLCRFWLRRLLVGNPFYLASAAFLLYGIYRISLDQNFTDKEMSQLVFNFTALQVYEGLLTMTALFLARRRIWYDSTLLVVIEAAFVLIPFLLVIQAILLSNSVAYLMCGLTLLLAAVKCSGLKRFYPELNFPPALLGIGAVIGVVNCVLPLQFKSLLDLDDAFLIVSFQEAHIRLILIGV